MNMNQMQCIGASCAEVDYGKAIVYWAKAELLKEKVKQKIDEKYGKKLDEVAELLVEVISEKEKSLKGAEDKQEELRIAFAQLYEGD